MRKTFRLLYFLIFFLGLTIVNLSINNSAALPVVETNDLISIGYRLTASATLVEVYTEEEPLKGRVVEDVFKPIGLYNGILGMELGELKDLIVPPDEGFSEYDPQYGAYAGLTLYYSGLIIYEINGFHVTEIGNGGLRPGSFGFYFLRVVLGIVGATAFVFMIYGGYKFYPRIFGKRCAVCKTLAIGTCKNCGRVFCERCYSNGCPYCKSRTLIRFKS